MLYLCLVHALSALPGLLGLFGLGNWINPEAIARWQLWLEPFLALQTVVEPLPGEDAVLAPAYRFGLAMLALSVLLNGWAILRLRVWNPSGEPIQQRERPEHEDEKDRARPTPRGASAGGLGQSDSVARDRHAGVWPATVDRKGCLFLGAGVGVLLRHQFAGWRLGGGAGPGAGGHFKSATGQHQAVTSITSEHDTGSLDLLLVTDLTPRKFIFGKLGGICYNTKEFLLAPLALTIYYACRGQLAAPPPKLRFESVEVYQQVLFNKNLEAAPFIIIGTLVLLAFTMMLGLHVALRNDKSRVAIVNTLATVFFLSVGTLICIYLILINGRFEYQWFSFIFFLAAGIGGLWWVLSGDRPSPALTIASWACPLAVYYSVTNILIGSPTTQESSDPLAPFVVMAGVFGFTVAAMLVPLLSEFDVALGRTTGGGE